jgi:hypothetical protein
MPKDVGKGRRKPKVDYLLIAIQITVKEIGVAHLTEHFAENLSGVFVD